jgi:hypothetical protein
LHASLSRLICKKKGGTQNGSHPQQTEMKSLIPANAGKKPNVDKDEESLHVAAIIAKVTMRFGSALFDSQRLSQ